MPAIEPPAANGAPLIGGGTRLSPLPEARPLPRWNTGLCGIVVRIDAADEDAQRLQAMGVCVGRRVELLKAGDPLILRVLGTRLGVSARLAERVIVAGCDAPQCPPRLQP